MTEPKRLDGGGLHNLLSRGAYQAAWEDLLARVPHCVACNARASTQMRMLTTGFAIYRCTSAPCVASTGTGMQWEPTPWAEHVTAGAIRGVACCRPMTHAEVAEDATRG